MPWVAVALGGAFGSLARHAVNRLVQHHWAFVRFPAATLAVNVIGCFVIGVLAGLVATNRLALRMAWREFAFVGVLGGFTTFSTFGLDTLTLLRTGDTGAAALNVLLHVIVGLSAVYVGFVLGS